MQRVRIRIVGSKPYTYSSVGEWIPFVMLMPRLFEILLLYTTVRSTTDHLWLKCPPCMFLHVLSFFLVMKGDPCVFFFICSSFGSQEARFTFPLNIEIIIVRDWYHGKCTNPAHFQDCYYFCIMLVWKLNFKFSSCHCAAKKVIVERNPIQPDDFSR